MQSQEEPGRCTDRRNSDCYSSILSQQDGRGRTCPQPQRQTSENPHLNTTQPSQLPKSCCQGNALINPAPSLGRRTCALGSQHRNLGSGVAARLHHRGWKTPGSITKGIKPFELPRTTNPRPSCVESHPSCSCLLRSCSSPATSQTLIPAHRDWTRSPSDPAGAMGATIPSLPPVAEQDPASRPCYFLLGASSPAQGLASQGAARSFASPHPPSAQPGSSRVQGEAVADCEFLGI